MIVLCSPPSGPSGQSAASPEGVILPPLAKTAQAPSAPVELSISREARLGFATLTPDDPVYEYVQKAEEYVNASRSKATRRAYDSDWRHFVAWCETMRLASLPAEPHTVALYLAFLANPGKDSGELPRKAATITRRLTSINLVHKTAGFEAPSNQSGRIAATTLRGIRRTIGIQQVQKEPLTSDGIQTILDSLDGPIGAARDKALLLIGFAGALRRSELAAMNYADLRRHRKGITIYLPHSETDQQGMGREVEIPYGDQDRTCAVLALEDWLKIAGISSGRVFRSVGQYGSIGKSLHPESVGEIIKTLVRKGRIANAKAYGGHSLRAGYVTEASAAGATDREIMQQTGHASVAMVHRYTRADQQDRQKTTRKLKLFRAGKGGKDGDLGAEDGR